MTHTDTGLRTVGAWVALAAVLFVALLALHGPPAVDLSAQIAAIAAEPARWSGVHWAAAIGLSAFGVAGLLALASGTRLTDTPVGLSAWAIMVVGAFWTMTTAVAEATVITDAAIAGNAETFAAWWHFAEAKGNGFAALALAVAAIAFAEMRTASPATPLWACGAAAIAGAISFVGWVLGSWLAVGIGAPIWLIGSILACAWLVWFGVSLMLGGARAPAGSGEVPSNV